jgi:hypothetical protein
LLNFLFLLNRNDDKLVKRRKGGKTMQATLPSQRVPMAAQNEQGQYLGEENLPLDIVETEEKMRHSQRSFPNSWILERPASTVLQRKVKVDPDVAYESKLCTNCKPTKPSPWEYGAGPLFWLKATFLFFFAILIILTVVAIVLISNYFSKLQPPSQTSSSSSSSL